MEPSQRQLELLALHSGGMTYARLALQFHLSEAMIDYELREMRRRLGAVNLYHAQVLALARGYLEIDGREECLFAPDRELVAA